MVLSSAPRNSAERSLIQSNSGGSSLEASLAALMAENTIQALLRLSHISRVSAVRWARALRRAVARLE